MTTDTFRQYRGLILAWRARPEWMRKPPNDVVKPIKLKGVKAKNVRYSGYRRVMLPTIRPLRGKGAIKKQSGRCRWCQGKVDEKKRRMWHQKCVNAYWAATGNQSALSEAIRKEYHLNNEDTHPPCDECGLTGQQAEEKSPTIPRPSPSHQTTLLRQRARLQHNVEPVQRTYGTSPHDDAVRTRPPRRTFSRMGIRQRTTTAPCPHARQPTLAVPPVPRQEDRPRPAPNA